MAISDGLRDREYSKFREFGTGSTTVLTQLVGTPEVSISGGIHIGSVSANVDSMYIQSGNNLHLGSAWSGIGSSLITNFGALGSSVVVTNFNDLGSSVVIENFPTHYPGSVYQSTSPWIVNGSVYVDNYTGSVYATIGSQASIYTILCGTSGTDIIPLKCTSDGYLITQATA